MLPKSTLNNLDFLQHIFQLASFNDKMQCFGSGFFSQIQISLFSDSGSCSRSAKNPDPIRKNPDPIRKNPDPDLWKLEFKYSRRKYYISYLALLLSFLVRLLQNLIKSSKPSFRSHKFIIGRIRIRNFKTRIWIGEKTRNHPDPKLWYWPYRPTVWSVPVHAVVHLTWMGSWWRPDCPHSRIQIPPESVHGIRIQVLKEQ